MQSAVNSCVSACNDCYSHNPKLVSCVYTFHKEVHTIYSWCLSFFIHRKVISWMIFLYFMVQVFSYLSDLHRLHRNIDYVMRNYTIVQFHFYSWYMSQKMLESDSTCSNCMFILPWMLFGTQCIVTSTK